MSDQVSQLQHVVSVKDALLQVYTHASDELESPTSYVLLHWPVTEFARRLNFGLSHMNEVKC